MPLFSKMAHCLGCSPFFVGFLPNRHIDLCVYSLDLIMQCVGSLCSWIFSSTGCWVFAVGRRVTGQLTKHGGAVACPPRKMYINIQTHLHARVIVTSSSIVA